MRSCRTLAGTVLVLVSAVVSARSPFAINGLHSDMVLSEAVAQAETLGGDCQIIAARPGDTGKIVQCEYRHCVEANQSAGCAEGIPAGAGPVFASQPIVHITLEAPADSARLTRIMMVYHGDTEALETGLIEAFGPTEADGAPTDKKSWSHARRWSWRAGQYRMGLLNSPPVIILATDQSPASPAGDTGADAAP